MLRTSQSLRKMSAVPLVGADMSKSIYKLTDWIGRNPVKSVAICLATGMTLVVADARFGHKNSVVSPNIKNHLEYETYDVADAQDKLKRGGLELTQSQIEKELQRTDDPFLRAEMKRVLEAESLAQKRAKNSTMLVTEGQLDAREPHWNVRNNERNWSIMARDQQKQKDSYLYRVDRSRDDDFGRNAQ